MMDVVERNDLGVANALLLAVLDQGGLTARQVDPGGKPLAEWADPHAGLLSSWMLASDMLYRILDGRRLWCARYVRDDGLMGRVVALPASPVRLDLDDDVTDAVRGLCLRRVLDDAMGAGGGRSADAAHRHGELQLRCRGARRGHPGAAGA